MKTIQRHGLFSLTFLLGILMSVNVMAGNEKSDTQKRDTPSFHGISVTSGIDLYLTQGNSEEVVIKADPDIINDVVTKVENGILHIYLKQKLHWVWHKERRAYVTFKELDQLDASAGSDVKSQNAFKLDKLEINVSSGADVDLEDLSAESVSLDTSSGADGKLSGKVVHLNCSTSSGADIDCSDLEAEQCTVSASSGADARV
ncbi:MAG TPA: head GIN domain-containing protein, partial [Sunxiuqinia sp.]|nr:head GIN domain-containing protein [Sunxiuqinia sp.]